MKPILANLLTDFGVTPGKLIAQVIIFGLVFLCSIAGRSVSGGDAGSAPQAHR